MSMMISDMGYAAVQPHTAAGVKAPPQAAETESPVRSRAGAVDEYIPAEKQAPSGRYWLGKDEHDQPKVLFDDPERTADEIPDASAPVKNAPGDEPERCTGSTDSVDREIERLKKQKETLEQQLSVQTDATKIKELERQLKQVERELTQKDNDAYRRRHTVFS